MSAGPTKGPWRLRFFASGGLEGVQGAPAEGEKYGKMVTNYRGIARPASEEGAANARLIAAAPELLETSERLANVADDKLATVREKVEAVRLMRAAIAKARGES